MKTLTQLYELLLEELHSSELCGICSNLQYLLHTDKLTTSEYLRITKHFYIYPKPPSFQQFSPFYFDKKDKESRIAFIKEILLTLNTSSS